MTTQNQGHSLNLSPVCLRVYEAAQSELIDITRLLLQVGKFRGQYTRQQQSVACLAYLIYSVLLGGGSQTFLSSV